MTHSPSRVLQVLSIGLVIAVCLAACSGGSSGSGSVTSTPPPPPPPAAAFTDATATSGISFTHGFSGPLTVNEVDLIVPNGVAAGDYDGDGDIDLFVVRGDVGPNLLYRNMGGMRFEEIAAGAGVALTKSATENYRHGSPAFVDLDGDDDLDLLAQWRG